MLRLTESTRGNPKAFLCDCGQQVQMVIHQAMLESHCYCGKSYFVPLDGHRAWNCCSVGDNKKEVE